jgi:hypothetical protein
MPTCFVIMGFGLKTDLATGRVLDLDKSYKNIIKPAVERAGFSCIRADEIQHSGMIDVPMYEMLYSADLVVADLSTANLNAVFELGVRYALRPRATIIIAESRFTIPFDASHIVVRHYEHLGPDIGYNEVIRMQQSLTELATALLSGDRVDSPVYAVLPDLTKPCRGPASGGVAIPAAAPPPAAGASMSTAGAAVSSSDTYAAKLDLARQAMNSNAFDFARKLLQEIYDEQTMPGADGTPKPARPGVIQQLALATYKAGELAEKTRGPEEALEGYDEAERVLATLDIDTTNDPETLGLWSAIHKRRATNARRSESQRKHDLDESIQAAERGFYIKRDYYTGGNLAYLLNVRASMSSGDDRIADNVLASRVRREVIEICERRLTILSNADQSGQAIAGSRSQATGAPPLEEERFWVTVTRADALLALGIQIPDDELKQIYDAAPAPWMKDSAQKQRDDLSSLLAQMRL